MIYNKKFLRKETIEIMRLVIYFLSNIAGGSTEQTRYLIELGVL